MRNSSIYNLLEYAHNEFPNYRHFYGYELFDMQYQAADYYHDKVDKGPIMEILKKHGYTQEDWLTHLRYSGSLLFTVQPEYAKFEACNEEVKKYYQQFPHIMVAHQTTYFYDKLKNIVRRKNPLVGRDKVNGVWAYYIIGKP